VFPLSQHGVEAVFEQTAHLEAAPFDNAEAYSAGDLLKELNQRGFSGRGFKTAAIGHAMKNMGFDSKKVRGTFKYIAVLADYDRQKRERIEDATDESEKPF
jgi:hypothetical protein